MTEQTETRGYLPGGDADAALARMKRRHSGEMYDCVECYRLEPCNERVLVDEIERLRRHVCFNWPDSSVYVPVDYDDDEGSDNASD